MKNAELYDSTWPFVAGGLLSIGFIVVVILGAKIRSWWVARSGAESFEPKTTLTSQRGPLPVPRPDPSADTTPSGAPQGRDDDRQPTSNIAEAVPDSTFFPHGPGFSEREEDEFLVLYGNRKQRKAARQRQRERAERRAATHPASAPKRPQAPGET